MKNLGIRAAPMQIIGLGLCCPIGVNSHAVTAAIRSGIDNFQRSFFKDNQQKKISTSTVPMDGYVGVTKLATMTEAALKDMMEQLPTDKLVQLNPLETALLIICPERDEGPEAVIQYYDSIAKALYKKLPAYKDYKAVVFNGRGRTGGALRRAQELLLGALIQK